jgi:hypothetical protein
VTKVIKAKLVHKALAEILVNKVSQEKMEHVVLAETKVIREILD